MIRTGFAYPNEVLIYQTFTKLWRKEFPHLKLRKKKTVSSKCLVCDDLEVSIMPATSAMYWTTPTVLMTFYSFLFVFLSTWSGMRRTPRS